MLKKLISGAAVAVLLSACGSHHTDSASSSGFQKPVDNQLKQTLPSVEEVYERYSASNSTGADLRVVDIDSLTAEEKFVVHLQPNFGKVIKLCKRGECESVIPGRADSSGVQTAGDYRELDEVDDLIAEVIVTNETQNKVGKALPNSSKQKSILIMPPDIELSELGASGVETPSAFWTDIATNYINEFSAQYFEKSGFDVSFAKGGALGISAKEIDTIRKLNSQVGLSIMQFQRNSIYQLPSLKDQPLDWPLGDGTKVFKEKYGADYGVFIYLRDSYASGSRVAAGILGAILFGGPAVNPGLQIGFATMVDFDTGKVVWFNMLVSTSADLRTFDAALETTDALYRDMPL